MPTLVSPAPKIPALALVSEDWQVAEETVLRPVSLIVQLRRFAYVLPWFRFGYAEGDDSTVLIVIGAHMIKVDGYGLTALLVAIAEQRVIRLVEPSENEAKFGVRGLDAREATGPGITSISVDLPAE